MQSMGSEGGEGRTVSRDQITEVGEGVEVILGPMGSHFGIFVTLVMEPHLVSENSSRL